MSSTSGTLGGAHSLINHLVQLQELAVAREQQEALMPHARLSELDASIRAMEQALPEDTRRQFVRLRKRSGLAIVPVAAGVCSACNMTLPVSLTQAIRMGERLYACPACARWLYVPESMPRMTRKTQRRGAPPKMGIERFSCENLMCCDLKARNAEEVLGALCGVLAQEGFVDDPQRLLEDALKREAILSTAVENGIAFPHVRGVEGGGLAFALGVHRKGIRFGAPGRALTRVFFFMVIPTAASAFYLKLLSGLTGVLYKEGAVDSLLEAETPEQLWKTLLRMTKRAIG